MLLLSLQSQGRTSAPRPAWCGCPSGPWSVECGIKPGELLQIRHSHHSRCIGNGRPPRTKASFGMSLGPCGLCYESPHEGGNPHAIGPFSRLPGPRHQANGWKRMAGDGSNATLWTDPIEVPEEMDHLVFTNERAPTDVLGRPSNRWIKPGI